MNNSIKNIKNCKVNSVWKRAMPKVQTNECMLVIGVKKENSVLNEYEDVNITFNYNYEKLEKLSKHELERVYFSYGMADIDIFYSDADKKYAIEWSPMDGCYWTFYITKKDFNSILGSLAPESDKM